MRMGVQVLRLPVKEARELSESGKVVGLGGHALECCVCEYALSRIKLVRDMFLARPAAV